MSLRTSRAGVEALDYMCNVLRTVSAMLAMLWGTCDAPGHVGSAVCKWQLAERRGWCARLGFPTCGAVMRCGVSLQLSNVLRTVSAMLAMLWGTCDAPGHTGSAMCD